MSEGDLILDVRDLRVRAGERLILNGLSLAVRAGEMHAIMGPNGSGKSTLTGVLAGRPGYEVVSGSATYLGRDLLAMPPEERAREGLFLAFQYPMEIPGVAGLTFLILALARALAAGGWAPARWRGPRTRRWPGRRARSSRT